MRLSELKDKAVISVEGARKVGRVVDVLVDRVDWHIAALIVKPVGDEPDRLVAGENIESVGPSAVTVLSSDAMEPFDRGRLRTGFWSLTMMMKSHILTEGGEVLGTIGGMDIDTDNRRVETIEYATGALAGLLGRQHKFAPEMVIGVGEDLVTVREGARPFREAGA